MSQTLPRSEILRGRKNFGLVFREGRSVPGRFFRCLMSSDSRLDLPAGSTIIFGVAVPSRVVRRAVHRNRIKRLARESYRLHKDLLLSVSESGRPVVLMFVFTPAVDRPYRSLLFSEIEQDIVNILSAVRKKLKPEAVR